MYQSRLATAAALVCCTVLAFQAAAYEIKEDAIVCYMAKCNNVAIPGDCAAATKAVKECSDRLAAKRRQAAAARQREYEAKHQAEIDALKKVEEGNNAVKGVGVPK